MLGKSIWMLQWGHASSSVESLVLRQNCRGRTSRFNGATLLQAWRDGPGQLVRLKHPASMGPRFFKRGEAHEDIQCSDIGWASMGPRFFKRGEHELVNRPTLLAAASMGPRFFKRGEWSRMAYQHEMCTASMGPRFFKRGEMMAFTRFAIAVSSFNGATLLQAWRVDVHRGEGAAGHRGFNGATLLQAWREQHRHTHQARHIRFNGATLLQAWRASLPCAIASDALGASMGPRFFKRGEEVGPRAERGQCRGFNGATLLQAWRGVHTMSDKEKQTLLQWGHASSSVERSPAWSRWA